VRGYFLVFGFALLAGCTQNSASTPSGAFVISDDMVRSAGPAAYAYLYGFKGGPDDGRWPVGPLTSVNGILYGVTTHAGSHRRGVVFAFDPNHGEHIVYSFSGFPNADQPNSLTALNGTLYGTSAGGKYRKGTVFAVTSDGSESLLHSFGNGTDGAAPVSLTPFSGRLYGITASGGAHDYGTIFQITTGGNERIVYSFSGGSDGAMPSGQLAVHDGRLYGTTYEGGTNACYNAGCGTVYEMTPSGTKTTLYAFTGKPDAEYPSGPVAIFHATLYGTAPFGGANNQGALYAVTLSGNERVVATFPSYAAGISPTGLFTNGTRLFGTTGFGPPGAGSLFEVGSGGTLAVIHEFYDVHHDGSFPTGYFAPIGKTWYGVTAYGGPKNRGTVFSITP
jgi:uncharacterized repeat protein (TIGR03803 family)